MEVNDVVAQEVLYKVTVDLLVQYFLRYNIINLHYALVYNNPCTITFNFSTSCAITLKLTI